MASRVIYKKSYAKINLFLYNLGIRPDNYHELLTLYYIINLYDRVGILPSEQFQIICDNPSVPCDSSNIISKIHSILKTSYGLNENYVVYLKKNIPLGAGLGGGSSNAATYLNLVDKTAKLNLSFADKLNILKSVGSDTPFFLYKPSGLASGRGEKILPVKKLPKMNLILIYPNLSISTAEIFNSPKLELTTLDNPFILKTEVTLEWLLPLMKNDLEKAVFSRYPHLIEIKKSLLDFGASCSLMSGSGSTFFGIYSNLALYQKAYNQLRKKYSSYLVLKV